MSSWGKKSEPTNNNDQVDTSNRVEGQKADAPPPPPENLAKQAPMRLNKETADPEAEINPHNEALAQRPVENAEQKLNDAEEYLKGTHLGKLQAWKQRVFLGGPRSGDWDEFDQLINEGKETVSQRRSSTSTNTTSSKAK